MKPPIIYSPNFFTNADDLFKQLKELAWVKRGNTPRQEYYCNDFDLPYVYGKGMYAREYEAQPYTPAIQEIREVCEKHAATKFEVCFLNRYLNQRDQLGWHADDSPEMDDARPIAIVSFGVEREIWFRPIKSTETEMAEVKPERFVLGHGSICLMQPGMQDTWQHRIPKASFECGERISLTFRGYVKVGAS